MEVKPVSVAEIKATPNAPEGMVYIVIGPNAWGRDKNLRKARENMLRSNVQSYTKTSEKKKWVYALVPEACYVDSFGGAIAWLADKVPAELDYHYCTTG